MLLEPRYLRILPATCNPDAMTGTRREKEKVVLVPTCILHVVCSATSRIESNTDKRHPFYEYM